MFQALSDAVAFNPQISPPVSNCHISWAQHADNTEGLVGCLTVHPSPICSKSEDHNAARDRGINRSGCAMKLADRDLDEQTICGSAGSHSWPTRDRSCSADVDSVTAAEQSERSTRACDPPASLELSNASTLSCDDCTRLRHFLSPRNVSDNDRSCSDRRD